MDLLLRVVRNMPQLLPMSSRYRRYLDMAVAQSVRQHPVVRSELFRYMKCVQHLLKLLNDLPEKDAHWMQVLCAATASAALASAARAGTLQ